MDGGTKFREWLKANKQTMLDASRVLDIYPNHISNICGGKTTPSLVTAFKIEDYTNGEVKARDFVTEAELKIKRKRL